MHQYTSAAERDYFKAESEPSNAYLAAEGVLADLKIATKDLMWINGSERLKTSSAVNARWNRLQVLFKLIRRNGDMFSPYMMQRIENKLSDAVLSVDKMNVDYDGDQSPTAYFGYHLGEYADVVVDALKEEMGEREADIFENNN